MVKKIFLVLTFVFLLPITALAGDLSIERGDIYFSISKPLAGEVIRIYATVNNPSQHDARASVRFFVDGAQIGVQPVTVLAYKSAAVFTDWAPMEGYYDIKIDIVDIDPADATLGNNLVSIDDFLVDLDTDGDGKYNQEDWDDDNDGVDDGVELSQGTDPTRPDTDYDGADDGVDQFPLDPNEKYDNDGDGIGNNADLDNDNDGVLNEDDPAPFDPNITGRESAPESPSAEATGDVPPEPVYKTPEPESPSAEASADKKATGDVPYEIEEVTYTFPDESEADYTLDIMIAKSRIGWNEFQFDVLGGSESFMYLWNFGDGELAQTVDPIHKFSNSGEYEISLSVSDGKGGLGEANEKIMIGFWNIGNPFILTLVSLLSIFGIALIGYLLYQGVIQKIILRIRK
ncbi:hypothetical protein KKF64_01960 [Patescibacteria group bacterium]|nr:hypothetical protein [Patescibacteria group bacterium]